MLYMQYSMDIKDQEQQTTVLNNWLQNFHKFLVYSMTHTPNLKKVLFEFCNVFVVFANLD